MLQAFIGTGVRQAWRYLKVEFGISLRHRKGVAAYKRLALQPPYRINLGCGPNVKSGWVNIDLWGKEADLSLDIREPLPFPDSCATIIYSEHFMEHLGYPGEVNHFLRESLRVLVPGGLFSVGVPDTEWPLLSYVSKDERYFKFARDHWHPSWCTTPIHQLNYHFRQNGQHKYAYDFETLSELLVTNGFSNPVKREFDPTLDSPEREIGTLYVDAAKPVAG